MQHFQYYNKWLSLLGSVLCVIVMFLLDWRMALASFLIFLMLYFVVVYRKPGMFSNSSIQKYFFFSGKWQCRESRSEFFFYLSLDCFLFADVNWGSSTQAQTYKSALASAHKLLYVGDHVKNYRPQILVLCGQPQVRPPLLDLAHWFTKNHSMLICADVVKVSEKFVGWQ